MQNFNVIFNIKNFAKFFSVLLSTSYVPITIISNANLLSLFSCWRECIVLMCPWNYRSHFIEGGDVCSWATRICRTIVRLSACVHSGGGRGWSILNMDHIKCLTTQRLDFCSCFELMEMNFVIQLWNEFCSCCFCSQRSAFKGQHCRQFWCTSREHSHSHCFSDRAKNWNTRLL